MSRIRILLLLALAAMAGLYFYDRDNSTRMTLAASVHSIGETIKDGPSTYEVTVDIDGDLHEISPLDYRPTFEVGDTLCVTRVIRQGEPDTYHRATGKEDC